GRDRTGSRRHSSLPRIEFDGGRRHRDVNVAVPTSSRRQWATKCNSPNGAGGAAEGAICAPSKDNAASSGRITSAASFQQQGQRQCCKAKQRLVFAVAAVERQGKTGAGAARA